MRAAQRRGPIGKARYLAQAVRYARGFCGRVKRDGAGSMQLSTKGRYAVMAMADLAGQALRPAVSLAEIAERQQLSLAYLEQLFARLRRRGLVTSIRGP